MDLSIRLTKDQQIAVAGGEVVVISLLPPKRSRTDSLADDAGGVDIPDKVGKLIAAWNDDLYIRNEALGESRNNPFPMDELPTFIKTFERALRELGLTKIKASLASYFRACRAGRHLWQNRNHGYSHLGGFVRKLLEKKGKRGWWVDKSHNVKDDYPELTLRIADAFARKWLGRREFGLENGSADHQKFANTARRVNRMVGKPFDEGRTVKLLLDCVGKQAERWDRDVNVGDLCSDSIWSKYLPQHYKGVLGKY